jgi:hypothetical protein
LSPPAWRCICWHDCEGTAAGTFKQIAKSTWIVFHFEGDQTVDDDWLDGLDVHSGCDDVGDVVLCKGAGKESL